MYACLSVFNLCCWSSLKESLSVILNSQSLLDAELMFVLFLFFLPLPLPSVRIHFPVTLVEDCDRWLSRKFTFCFTQLCFWTHFSLLHSLFNSLWLFHFIFSSHLLYFLSSFAPSLSSQPSKKNKYSEDSLVVSLLYSIFSCTILSHRIFWLFFYFIMLKRTFSLPLTFFFASIFVFLSYSLILSHSLILILYIPVFTQASNCTSTLSHSHLS